MMAATPPTVGDITAFLEQWAPPGLAASWDNSGLQVGRAGRAVTCAVIALDCTPQVVAEAKERGAEMVLTHHPLLFKPPRTLTDGHPVSAVALALAEAGVALYSIHTNLDAAPGGVSFALARALGLRDVAFLAPLETRPLRKLVVYVPESHADAVRRAMGAAGAGRIGAYDDCAFELRGHGWFTPRPEASPYLGASGGPTERVAEARIEAEVTSWNLSRVLAAVRDAHPYEEIAYDVIPVEQPFRNAGYGAVGSLPDPEPLRHFLERVADALHAPGLRHVGDASRTVARVAVCGGSGTEFLGAAISARADAFVTADVTYHRWFDALGPAGEPRIALIDAGHYETEAVAETLLADALRSRFPEVEWRVASHPTNPVSLFVRR